MRHNEKNARFPNKRDNESIKPSNINSFFLFFRTINCKKQYKEISNKQKKAHETHTEKLEVKREKRNKLLSTIKITQK